jgi:hypothetical protein
MGVIIPCATKPDITQHSLHASLLQLQSLSSLALLSNLFEKITKVLDFKMSFGFPYLVCQLLNYKDRMNRIPIHCHSPTWSYNTIGHYIHFMKNYCYFGLLTN